MSIVVNIQYALPEQGLPTAGQIERWAQAALCASRQADAIDAELTVRIIGEAESATLNGTYRQRPGPTNVLSFPYEYEAPARELFEADAPNYLGDIAICAPVVEREAREQHKDLTAHWAHMVVHGSLHLLGYDHIDAAEAEAMEALEINILSRIGYANPYLDIEDV